MVDVFSLFQRDERISSPPHSHASDYLFHQFSPDESARDHGLVDHDRSVVVFEASCDKNVFFGERYVGEREREKERKTKFETHYSFGYTKHKGNIIVPERVIGKHQNNPEKRPVFHAERRNEEGEEHGEEGGVHRWNACGVRPPRGGGGGGGGGGNEASLGISLSRFVVVRAQNADFMQGKIEHIF